MGKVFVGQTKLTIKLDTGSQLNNVDVAKIKYIKPEGTLGEFTATVSGKNIFYDVINETDFDIAGLWVFYAYIIYNDTKIIIGQKASLNIYNQGE